MEQNHKEYTPLQEVGIERKPTKSRDYLASWEMSREHIVKALIMVDHHAL